MAHSWATERFGTWSEVTKRLWLFHSRPGSIHSVSFLGLSANSFTPISLIQVSNAPWIWNRLSSWQLVTWLLSTKTACPAWLCCLPPRPPAVLGRRQPPRWDLGVTRGCSSLNTPTNYLCCDRQGTLLTNEGRSVPCNQSDYSQVWQEEQKKLPHGLISCFRLARGGKRLKRRKRQLKGNEGRRGEGELGSLGLRTCKCLWIKRP